MRVAYVPVSLDIGPSPIVLGERSRNRRSRRAGRNFPDQHELLLAFSPRESNWPAPVTTDWLEQLTVAMRRSDLSRVLGDGLIKSLRTLPVCAGGRGAVWNPSEPCSLALSIGALSMESSMAFLASAAALLLVPGPTNSLIATNGAIAGLSRTVLLLPAELCGYMLAIVGWGLGLAAVVTAVPPAGVAAKLVAGATLIRSARKLWFFADRSGDRRWSGLQDVFLVTLTNPKALVFAVAIVPHLKDGDLRSALPYLGSLGALIPTIGFVWAAAGAGLACGLSATVSTAGFARVGATAMLCFGVGLIVTAVPAAVF